MVQSPRPENSRSLKGRHFNPAAGLSPDVKLSAFGHNLIEATVAFAGRAGRDGELPPGSASGRGSEQGHMAGNSDMEKPVIRTVGHFHATGRCSHRNAACARHKTPHRRSNDS